MKSFFSPTFFCLFFYFFGFVGLLNAAPKGHLGFSTSGTWTGVTTLTVKDSKTLQPIEGALLTASNASQAQGGTQTLILGKTDATGTLVAENLDAGPKVFTARKSGYTSVSVATSDVSQLDLVLSPKKGASSQVVLSGKTTGWEAITDSSQVYAGLVFKALSASELVNFDPNGLISPLDDTVNVMGERKIPSNIVLPKQNVSYSFFNIKLDKPNYRIPLNSGSQQLVTLQGKAPAQALVDAQTSGSGGLTTYLGVINKLKVSKVGISQAVSVNNNTSIDLVANNDLAQGHQVTVQKPPFASEVLVAAVSDLNNDMQTLVPTDIKVAMKSTDSGPTPVKLSSPKKSLGSTHVVSFAIELEKNRVRRASGVLNAKASSSVSALPFLNAPKLIDQTTLPQTFEISAASSGVGAYVFSSELNAQTQETEAEWIVFVTPSASKLVFAPDLIKGLGKKIEVSLLQLEFDQTPGTDFDGVASLNHITRFSRSAATISSARGLEPLGFAL